ncbi:hypothetical protein O3P69_006385 [Scylla paramamosain]|uniref:Uncharacterized protein n=1 Tax=Scylla paramamosain TaxID=85552 RepID=A0AAW0U721_SCYPA
MGVEAAREEASGRKQRRHAVVKREVNSERLEKVARGSRKQDDQACSSGVHKLPGNSTKPTMSWILGRLAKLQEDPTPGNLVTARGEKRGQQKVVEVEVVGGTGGGFELDTFDYSREDLADQMLETLQALRFRGVSNLVTVFIYAKQYQGTRSSLFWALVSLLVTRVTLLATRVILSVHSRQPHLSTCVGLTWALTASVIWSLAASVSPVSILGFACKYLAVIKKIY